MNIMLAIIYILSTDSLKMLLYLTHNTDTHARARENKIKNNTHMFLTFSVSVSSNCKHTDSPKRVFYSRRQK